MSSVGQHASDFGHSGLVPEREHDRQRSQTDTTRMSRAEIYGTFAFHSRGPGVSTGINLKPYLMF